MSAVSFSHNPHEEQQMFAGLNFQVLALFRNVLVRHIEQRLIEYQPPGTVTDQKWQKTCKALALEFSESTGELNDLTAQQIESYFKEPEDPTTVIRALKLKTVHGPLFGPAISKHSEALLKHRNESAHFSSKFNRQKTYDFMTRVIEIFEVLNEDEHATEVRDLRGELHFDEYLLFVKKTRPQVEASIEEAEPEAPRSQEVRSEPALVPEQDGGVQPENKKEAKVAPAASKASSQKNKAEKFFSEADKNLKETIKNNSLDEAVQYSIEVSKRLIQLSDPDKACRMLQKAQFLQPQASKKLRAEYHEARAMAYAAMGNTKAAKTWFAKALALADAPSKLANRIAKRMAECDKAS